MLVLTLVPLIVAAEPPGVGMVPAEVRELGAADDLDELGDLSQQVRRTYRRARPAVVAISAGGGQGSGVIVSPDGLVLTAGHVSGRPGRPVRVTLDSGREVRGVVLGQINDYDSGVVQITDEPTEPGGFPFVPMGESDALIDGQWLIALGHPGGLQENRPPVLRLGRLIVGGRFALRTDNTLVGGDSGGPLLDLAGNVVGIHSRIGQRSFANFHVPIDHYRRAWSRLVPSGEERAYMGVRFVDNNLVLRIDEVIANSPAQIAGLREGDVLRQIDGQRLSSFDDLLNALTDLEPGDEVTVRIRRPGRAVPLTLQMTLAAAPRR
jgi:serine protease Do